MEIANSIIAFWARLDRLHIRNTSIVFLIIANRGKFCIRIYYILAFICGPTVPYAKAIWILLLQSATVWATHRQNDQYDSQGFIQDLEGGYP